MTTTLGELAQCITAITALCAFVSSRLNSKKIKSQAQKIEEIHEATNGLVAKLGDAKLAQGDAEGHARGLEQGRDEQSKVP